jgi:hypothetical protein
VMFRSILRRSDADVPCGIYEVHEKEYL